MQFVKPLLISLMMTFVCCQVQPEKAESDLRLPTASKVPVIYDTSEVAQHMVFGYDFDKTWLSTAEYTYAYIGEYADTIFIDYHLAYIQMSPPHPLPPSDSLSNQTRQTDLSKSYKKSKYYFQRGLGFKHWSKADFEITVDTSTIIEGGFPIMIRNLDKDSAAVAYGSHIPLIMQAKDTAGVWKPIERRFVYGCGVGLGTLVLPPDEIVLSFAPVQKGNFETELRLALDSCFSNTFRGSINLRQFESRFDDTGNYKEEYLEERKKRKASKT